MKRTNRLTRSILTLLLIGLLTAVVASCGPPVLDTETDETTATPTAVDTTAVETPLDTTDSLPEDPDADFMPEIFPETFDTYDELRAFVEMVDATDNDRAYYDQAKGRELSYVQAKQFAELIRDMPVPTVNSEDMEWEVSVDFHYYPVDKKVLAIYYDIGEIRYSFAYSFYDYSPEPKEGDPVHTVELDGYSVDLYGPDAMYGKWYGGYMTYGTTTITVSVHVADDITAVTLDHFDLLPLIPEAETEISDDQPEEPPLMAVFDSIETMVAFLQATHGSEDEYAAMTTDSTIHYSDACQIARYLESHTLPLPVTGQTVENFRATYYANRNELVMIYQIDGIYYRFLCGYNAPDMIYSGSVVGMMTLDQYELEMRRENDQFYSGSVSHGTTTLTAIIYSDADVSTWSLEAFDLKFVLPESE